MDKLRLMSRPHGVYLVSLALDPGQRKDDHLPGKHLLVKLVATVFNRGIQIDDLVSYPQLMDNILGIKKKSEGQFCPCMQHFLGFKMNV